MLLRDLQAQVLCATPSYAVTIAEALEEEGIGPDELSLEVGLFGAEPWSEAMRARARAAARAARAQLLRAVGDHRPGRGGGVRGGRTARTSTRTTSSSRCSTPTPEPVAAGEPGELVITTLTKEALPLLRYRTADIADVDATPCACGRTLARMGRSTAAATTC